MPCYLCAAAIVQFGSRKVMIGELRNFEGTRTFMESHEVDVIDLDLRECYNMMRKFISENRDLWNEDIGK